MLKQEQVLCNFTNYTSSLDIYIIQHVSPLVLYYFR